MTIYDRIKEIVAQTIEAREDGKVSFSEAWGITGKILGATAQAMADLQSRPEFGETVAAAERIYDEYVAPLDIAVIPNWLEKSFDAILRGQIIPAISALYDALEG